MKSELKSKIDLLMNPANSISIPPHAWIHGSGWKPKNKAEATIVKQKTFYE